MGLNNDCGSHGRMLLLRTLVSRINNVLINLRGQILCQRIPVLKLCFYCLGILFHA